MTEKNHLTLVKLSKKKIQTIFFTKTIELEKNCKKGPKFGQIIRIHISRHVNSYGKILDSLDNYLKIKLFFCIVCIFFDNLTRVLSVFIGHKVSFLINDGNIMI